MHARWLASPALSLLLLFGSGALAEVAVPPLRAPVTDLTGTLTSEQIATLDQQLRAFEAKKGSQIAILIVPTTQPETIEQYGIRVAEAWKPGRRGVNDGAPLLVAKDDRPCAWRSATASMACSTPSTKRPPAIIFARYAKGADHRTPGVGAS